MVMIKLLMNLPFLYFLMSHNWTGNIIGIFLPEIKTIVASIKLLFYCTLFIT